MTKRIATLCLVSLSLACGSRPTATETTTPTRTTGAADADRRVDPSTTVAGSTSSDPRCSLEPVYFEYDSNTLDRRARDALSSGAACLRERADATVVLVGGADERGTEEYNLSLGDRRARAVQSYLTDSGVEASRLRVHTVGEEWSSGADDASMARDRRVEPRSAGR